MLYNIWTICVWLQVLARIEVITDLLDTAINDAQDIMDESYLEVQARIDRTENTII